MSNLSDGVRCSRLSNIRLKWKLGLLSFDEAQVMAKAEIRILQESCHAMERSVLTEIAHALPYIMPMLIGVSPEFDRQSTAEATRSEIAIADEAIAASASTSRTAEAIAPAASNAAPPSPASESRGPGSETDDIAIVPEQHATIHDAMASGATLILLKPGTYQVHSPLRIERPLTIRGLGKSCKDVVVECASNIAFNTRLSYDNAEGCELGHFTLKSCLWQAGGVHFVPAPFLDLMTGRTTIDDMRIDHPGATPTTSYYLLLIDLLLI